MGSVKVHFLCQGNMHRSRLAEAYFKSLEIPNFKVSSSGLNAEEYEEHATSRFADQVVARHPELEPFTKLSRQQTTRELLRSQDIIVCLDKRVYDEAVRDFDLDARKTQVWHIEDIDERTRRVGTTMQNETAVATLTEDIFKRMRRKCDALAKYLTETSWADIMDDHNKPTGLRLPIAWANDRGFWHRGCHVVVMTADGGFLVEKRSKSIVFAPGLLDITLGGSVDSGETPLQAAAREANEELGIAAEPADFQPLFIRRWNSHHPHYKKITKVYLYTYLLQLPVDAKAIQTQESEVESVYVLSEKKVARLLRTHRLKNIGKLSSGYTFYEKAVAMSRQAKAAAIAKD